MDFLNKELDIGQKDGEVPGLVFDKGTLVLSLFFEASTKSSVTWLYITSAKLMSRRLPVV